MVWLYVKGWYYDHDAPQRFRKGTTVLHNGKVVEAGEAIGNYPRGQTVKGILLPMMPNAHTHLADYAIRDRVAHGMTVQELVSPPNGIKHRFLQRIDVRSSIRRAVFEMNSRGVGSFCDFREGGVEGVEDMARALVADGLGMKAMILGRPVGLTYDKDEVEAILRISDGLGISGMGDWDHGQLQALAAHVKNKGKLLGMHVSEVEREDIDRVLDLGVDLVIHMTKGVKGDFNRLSVLDIPVITCPRSNLFYGRKPPLKEMLDAQVELCIGTDNAMMSDLSIFGELRAVRRQGLSPLEAWGMIENSWKLLNRNEKMHNGAPEHKMMIVTVSTDDPLGTITQTGTPMAIMAPSGKTPLEVPG